MLSFQVPDAGFDRHPPLHPAPRALRGPPSVAFVDMNLNGSRIAMPPVAHAHNGMLGITGNSLNLLQGIFQRVGIIRVGGVTPLRSCVSLFTSLISARLCFFFLW
jgi:hypothetical protein